MFYFQFILKWYDVEKFFRYLLEKKYKNHMFIISCQHFRGSSPVAYFFFFPRHNFFARAGGKILKRVANAVWNGNRNGPREIRPSACRGVAESQILPWPGLAPVLEIETRQLTESLSTVHMELSVLV
jgi:hypothetical protein